MWEKGFEVGRAKSRDVGEGVDDGSVMRGWPAGTRPNRGVDMLTLTLTVALKSESDGDGFYVLTELMRGMSALVMGCKADSSSLNWILRC